MDELQGLVSRRFQLFTQLVMWTIELQKLEACLADAVPDGASEDSDFNAILMQLMAKDMRRVDGMDENLTFLKQQVDEVEHDAVVMGIMLGKRVFDMEEKDKVDVILSVVNSEMRSVRSDFDQKLSAAMLSKMDHHKAAEMLEGSGSKDVQELWAIGRLMVVFWFWTTVGHEDLEEKVKRLQDSQQQSMLKIAGLRSAHKHAEAQANFALEKLKRLQLEVGSISDVVTMFQLPRHGAAIQHDKDSGFRSIVSVGAGEKDKGDKPRKSLKGGATMPTRQFEKTKTEGADAVSPDAKLDASDEVNAARIAKMGRRLLELDSEA
eukprot:g29639.t1